MDKFLKMYLQKRHGFSLVEVTIAMGIFTFAALPILGLMSVALTSTRNSSDMSTATQLAGGVAARLEQQNFSSLANGTTDYFFDDFGKPLASESNAVYRAVATIGNSDSSNLKRVEISVNRLADPNSVRNFCYLIFYHRDS